MLRHLVDRTSTDYSVGLLVNTNLVTFWMLYHAYSDPNLLEQLREEIKSCISLDDKRTSITDVDINRLQRSCPLAKSTFFEVLRVYVMSFTFKDILQDLTIQESAEDAAVEGRTQPETYVLRKGEKAIVAHCAHQMDPRYWPNPDEFQARRFMSNATKGTEEIEVNMKTMKVFGGGGSMCKGRNYAEREVLGFVAAIVSLWDIEPVDGGNGWRHPGANLSAGASVPKKNLRVRLRKRA